MRIAAKTASSERRVGIGPVRSVSAGRSSSWIAVVAAASIIVAWGHAQAQGPASKTPSSYADPRLPVGAPSQVTIRFSAEDAAARHRASDLAQGLSGQGLDVVGPIASPGRIASSTVGYFYAEDRPGAEIAVRVLGPAWKLVQQRMPTREPFPRPGALELAVAGP